MGYWESVPNAKFDCSVTRFLLTINTANRFLITTLQVRLTLLEMSQNKKDKMGLDENELEIVYLGTQQHKSSDTNKAIPKSPLKSVQPTFSRLSRKFGNRVDNKPCDDIILSKRAKHDDNPVKTAKPREAVLGGGAEQVVETPREREKLVCQEEDDNIQEVHDVSSVGHDADVTMWDIDDIIENKEMNINEWKVDEIKKIVNQFKEKLNSRQIATNKSVTHSVVHNNLDKILGIIGAEEIEKRKKLSDYMERIPEPTCDEFTTLMAQAKENLEKRKDKSKSAECVVEGCESTYINPSAAKIHIILVHMKLRRWRCTKCHMEYGAWTGLVKHVNKNHLGVLKTCPECKFTGSVSAIQYHSRLGHFTPSGQKVLFASGQGKIEFRLFEIDFITVRFGYTWTVWKVNWINDDNNPVNLSVGISRFVDLQAVLREFWEQFMKVMSGDSASARWVELCGSARREFRKGHRIDWTSVTSLGIPAVSKVVATQVKGLARKHYDAIYIIATEEAAIFLEQQKLNIIEQLDSFIEELPPHNRDFVLKNRPISLPELSSP